MNERELKPCPFCGGKVKVECVDDEFFYISCESCASGTSFGKVFEDGTAGDATKEETISAWNKRISKTSHKRKESK